MKHAVIHIPLFIALVLSAVAASAQHAGTEVICDPAITSLMDKHILVNEKLNGMPGYRIQIFFDSGNNSKTRGQAVYEAFSARYPEIRAYLTFIAPNYKVRVGDFRTRLDAVRFLQEILPDYPGAYVVTDQIHLPKAK